MDLTITDGLCSLKVNKKEAIRMELNLNKSQHKREWIHLGDALFDFGSNKKDISVLTVTTEQYLFLEELFNMLDYYRETR